MDAFADYSRVVGEHFGDRVALWVTQVEPWVTAWLGYGLGVHAPGRCSEADAVVASHHLLLSHGRAVEVLRGVAPRAEVGIALNLEHFWAATDRDDDHEALRWWDGTGAGGTWIRCSGASTLRTSSSNGSTSCRRATTAILPA